MADILGHPDEFWQSVPSSLSLREAHLFAHRAERLLPDLTAQRVLGRRQ
ncbi:hypothetical protein [Planotetraspora silvatica]|nr:hypothetical protein [Planotetraspora silvatica]